MLAGMTLAAILIPQSISYATSLAKLSPVTGLVRCYVTMANADRAPDFALVRRCNPAARLRRPRLLATTECCTRGRPKSDHRPNGKGHRPLDA